MKTGSRDRSGYVHDVLVEDATTLRSGGRRRQQREAIEAAGTIAEVDTKLGKDWSSSRPASRDDACTAALDLRSPSEKRHAHRFSGSDEVRVQGGEWKAAALREFQVRDVVQGEPVAFSQPGRPRGTTRARRNYRRRSSRAAFIDEVLDFQVTEQDSLAGFAQTIGSAFCLLAVESGLRRHEPGNGLSAAGYYYFRPVLDLVEERAQLVLCFKRSDFAHGTSPAS